ncbi:EamA family transporter [Cryobacterium zongtaii]|uniref:EamA family transporter n=1 Tax=Cryobacterium zongtaii TaxID=1259217 RepID=A0A2S3ZFA6_9MICO|nr:EamA family transporter [Cryobacterium zongtaii]
MPALLRRFHVDLLLLLVAASWGSTYLVAKELVQQESVVALLALRMLLAAALMAAIVAARRNRITAAELRAGVLLGAILAAVFAFETFGIAHTSATNAGLIISLTIVFTPILDSAVSGRQLPGRFFLATTIAIGGVALLASNGAFHTPSLGDLLILVAAIIRAIHVTSMFTLTGTKPMNSLHLTTVQLATCATLFSAASLFYGDSIPHFLANLDTARAVLFLYLVLACTVFAFLVQTWAVRRTSPSRVSLLLGTEPIWAAIVGVAIARDTVTLPGYFGIALILAGTAWGRSLEHGHRLSERARDEASLSVVERSPSRAAAFGASGSVVEGDLVAVGVGEGERSTEWAVDRGRDDRVAVGDESVVDGLDVGRVEPDRGADAGLGN